MNPPDVPQCCGDPVSCNDPCTPAKPLDDPHLQQVFGWAIEGAMASGYQNTNPAPEGHWLAPWWQRGRNSFLATEALAGLGMFAKAKDYDRIKHELRIARLAPVAWLRQYPCEALGRDMTDSYWSEEFARADANRFGGEVFPVYTTPPAAQPVAPITTFDHLANRGMHELRTDELPAYLQSVAVNHGAMSQAFMEAARWVAGELERKTNGERVLAVKLDAARADRSAWAAAALAGVPTDASGATYLVADVHAALAQAAARDESPKAIEPGHAVTRPGERT